MVSGTSAIRLTVIAIVIALGVRECTKTERHTPTLTKRVVGHIVVAGQHVSTEARVVLWSDPGGYNAYLEHRTTGSAHVLPTDPAPGCNTPKRYSVRPFLEPEGGRPISSRARRALLRDRIHQVVIHYDAAGSSRRCFGVLHDERGLSAHFLVDVDGTIYQTLDVVERARHAGPANDRSVGIEIANLGAYADVEELMNLREIDDSPPAETKLIVGVAQGRRLHQFPFTNAQYEALGQLIRSLRTALPKIELRYPRRDDGQVATRVLPQPQRGRFSGIVGHLHVSANKIDPGPAFDWPRLLRSVRRR